MHKIWKIAAAALVFGILLCGIGGGIVFAEYSSFKYEGTKNVLGAKEHTVSVDYKLKKTEQKTYEIRVDRGYHHTIVEDPSVPKDTIRYEVVYTGEEDSMMPQVYEDIYREDIYLESGYVISDTGVSVEECRVPGHSYLNFCVYSCEDDFSTFMKMKDVILNDIKQRKIASYESFQIESVSIVVNPNANFDYVVVEND